MAAASRAGRVVVAAALLLLVLAACGYLPRPLRVPMRTLDAPSGCPTRPETLIVMLPGAYSFPEDFVAEGFVDAVRARGIAADMRLVDAHLGYYERRLILDRLEADVIAPARAAGYRRIWLAGISVGAFGSMLYAQAHPGAVDGIIAIGPYLGEAPVAAAIEAQGGLARWRPPAATNPGPTDAPDAQGTGALWRWLQGYLPGAGERRPPLLVGYGVDDRFAASQRLLAAVLPPDRVATAPGGHEWKPWRETWARLLALAPLPHDAACRAAAPDRR